MKIRKISLLISLMLTVFFVYAREYHVSVKGSDKYEGSALRPFRTIQRAARIALPGDVITVHAGTYREWINPAHGGESDSKRITYRAVQGEKVEIKGSEIIKNWEPVKEGVWKVTLPNTFFGDYNPYQDSINGDWFSNMGRIHHTGEVFLNGKSLFEEEKPEKIFNARLDPNIKFQEGSDYTWYCENDSRNTTIWANFHQFDPNKELVEITTRKTCFYPDQPGINYLTIQGFHFSQAATQWAAPTAEQIGLIATHWNKGWIIENNTISDSKCSGITLGKERSTGHNVWSANKIIDGAIHYIEVVFRTLRNGWNKQNIGSHIVRNNEIFNCEQTGICGSMGAAFSTVTHNYIHHIFVKRQFNGAEIGGIKFHGAIDTRIENNRIHDALRAIWLDWMAQGTRVSKNLLYDNDAEDLFIEVCHGPTLVDNNFFLSPLGIKTQSEGVSYVHNLIAGQICMWPEPARFTPYHLPHSTELAGLSPVYSGDDRYFNNIFLGYGKELTKKDKRINFGLVGYDGAELPVWIDGNVYYNQAIPSRWDNHKAEDHESKPSFSISVAGSSVYLSLTWNKAVVSEVKTHPITTFLLGKAKLPKEAFENPDGTPLEIHTDYLDRQRSDINPSPGPIENPEKNSKIKVW